MKIIYRIIFMLVAAALICYGAYPLLKKRYTESEKTGIISSDPSGRNNALLPTNNTLDAQLEIKTGTTKK